MLGGVNEYKQLVNLIYIFAVNAFNEALTLNVNILSTY